MGYSFSVQCNNRNSERMTVSTTLSRMKREARSIFDGAAKQMPQMFAQTNGKQKEANTMLTVLIFNNKFSLTMQCHSSSWDIPQANFKFWVWKKACSGVHFTLSTWSSVKLASLFFCYMSHIYFELTKDHTDSELERLNDHFSIGLKPPSLCKDSPCCR